MYKKLFNSTEVFAVLSGFPKQFRADIWRNNFYEVNRYHFDFFNKF